jgi:hypothetical protein
MRSHALAHIVAACLLATAFAAVAQPVLRSEAPAAPLRVGEPGLVRLVVSWEGAPDAYIVFPPEFRVPEWASHAEVRTRAYAEGGSYAVVHEIALVPREAGEFQLEALRVPYSQHSADARGGVLRGDPPYVLRAEPITLRVRAGFSRVQIFALAVLPLGLAAAGGAVLAWRRRRRPAVVQIGPREQAQAVLHEARRHRLDGDFYRFYQGLAQAAGVLAAHGGDPALAERLRRETQAVGYQGMRPTDDAMDAEVRELERQLSRWKEERE